MDQTARESATSSEQQTTPCPLCGLKVESSARTCPRCKSRMDAAPARIGDLAGSFDENGTYTHDTLAATARLHLPSSTAPLPALDGAQDETVWEESYIAHQVDLSGLDIHVSDQASVTPSEQGEQPEHDSAASAPTASPAPPPPLSAREPSTATETASAPETTAPSPKRSRIHIAAGIAAALFVVLLLGGGAFMAAQANTLNDISDARVEADIRADAQFTVGSASAAFVDEAPYEISRVRLSAKELVETGVDAHATVMIGNEFFDESREVVVHYRKAQDSGENGATEDGWVHECVVESHAIQPKRGISNDADYAIEGALAGLVGSSACQVSVPFEGSVVGSWFATSYGTRVIGYTFTNDAWERTSVDDSQVGLSYQNLVGSYANEQSGRTGGFTSFSITSVDDASATFTGTFAFKSARGLFGDTTTVQGMFSGSIATDGTIKAEGTEQAGTASFTGKATGNGLLKLEATVYGKETGWLSGKPKGTTFSTTLEKKSGTPEALPAEPENASSTEAPTPQDDERDRDDDASSSDSHERDTSTRDSRDDWWTWVWS